jgi:pyruvate dehydrogenase E2 component (dihydrolipoamide acetyltransferase)
VSADPSPVESLDHAERWLRDGLAVLRPAVSIYQVSVDMTVALTRLERLRQQGTNATATHLLVHAVARVLADNPTLHQIVAGTRRLRPASVDIGLSVAGETFVAPLLVIEGADSKDVPTLAQEMTRRTPEVRSTDARMLKGLRTWGWLLPLGGLRRTVLRMLFRSPSFRRRGTGTFQVSTVSVDWACSSTFSTAGVLIAGNVSSQVLAINGEAVVRPVMKLTLSSDHGVWDGRASARLLSMVKARLEAADCRAAVGGSHHEKKKGGLPRKAALCISVRWGL